MLAKFFQRAWASAAFRYSMAVSHYWRRRFERATRDDYRFQPSAHRLSQVGIISLCGQRQVGEQILSILSFLQQVGVPEKWTVVSDGSLAEEDRARLRALHPVINITDWEQYVREESRSSVERINRYSPFGKKLAVCTSLPLGGTSVYVDTDVVFFPAASELRELLLDVRENRFLRDNPDGLVREMITPEELAWPQVNGGFLIQVKPIDWSGPLARLGAFLAAQPPTFQNPYVEQTVLHLGFNASGARQLDEQRYVLRLDDAYAWRDCHVNAPTVLRHYVVNTRNKFWRHARSYLK